MADFFDDFDRSDATTLGPGWIPYGGSVWGITGGKARWISGLTSAIVCRDAGSADVHVEAMFPQFQARAGLAFRVSDALNYLMVFHHPGQANTWVFRVEDGVEADYPSPGSAAGSQEGKTLSVRCIGDQVSVYSDGILIIGPLTIPFNQGATQHGLMMVSGQNAESPVATEWFRITDLAPPPPLPPTPSIRLIPAIMKYIADHVDEPIVIRKGPISPRSFPLVIVEKLSASTRPGSDTTLNTSLEEFYFQVTVASLDPEERDRIGEKVEAALRPSHPTDPRPPILWDQGPKGREVTRYKTDQREREQTDEAPGALTVFYYEIDMILLIQRGGID